MIPGWQRDSISIPRLQYDPMYKILDSVCFTFASCKCGKSNRTLIQLLQRKTCFSFAYFMIFNDTHLQYSPEELIVTYSVT